MDIYGTHLKLLLALDLLEKGRQLNPQMRSTISRKWGKYIGPEGLTQEGRELLRRARIILAPIYEDCSEAMETIKRNLESPVQKVRRSGTAVEGVEEE